MKQIGLLAAVVVCAALVLPRLAAAQTAPAIPPSITTPDKVESRLGTLDFKDGMPSPATMAKVYDNLDFTHAVNAFMNTMQGVNMAAIRKGILAVGVKDNEIGLFSELMDAKSLFLTANADTVYFVGFIDLTKGPMVFETPPEALGVLDDMWWRWVTDFGLPGPDRGEGGKYLLLPPGYDGPLPEGGYFVARSRTTRVVILGRLFMENNDPKPAADLIRKTTKIYPYEAGGVGTSIAEFLTGKKARRARPCRRRPCSTNSAARSSTPFHRMTSVSTRCSTRSCNRSRPPRSIPSSWASLAAIGIIKGKPFAPDDRMKKILTEALAVANATSRTLFLNPRAADWYYYPGSAWMNPLFISGSEFETPIPMITREGVKPFPPTGYRTLDARSAFFYGITGITPAMSMRLTGIGSQYLFASLDADKQYFDGAKTYKVTLPKGIPEEKFWSFTLYDNQTRSMLDTPQRYPRAGSQSYPSPAAEPDADGSTTVYFSPTQPAGVKRGNWIQTDPKKGWFMILRLYSPLEPFFTKEWRPSEIALVR